MKGLWARLRYFARTAWVGLRSSGVTCTVAIVTISVSLLLVGAFALLVSNMEGLIERFGSQVRLTAYFKEAVGEEVEIALRDLLAEREDVASVEWVSKEAALTRFRERVGGQTELLEGLDANPLPASLEIALAPSHQTPAGLEELSAALAAEEAVDEVVHGHAWVEGYARTVEFLRASGIVLGGVLVMAALLIVTNTIRLAVYARSDELDILLLVGATRGFIAVPFLLEGLVEGLVGGLLALGLLYATFLGIGAELQESLAFLLGHAPPRFLSAVGATALVVGGAALGLIGSLVAVFQGLRA
jgi:cell division transport system permease protein